MGKFQDLMDRELRIRGLAENTRRSYLEKMRRFVRHFMRPPDQLTAEDVKQYQLFLTKNRKMTWSTFNVHVCALRFFYRHVLPVAWSVEHIPYQKTGKRLPVVLSGEEVVALFDAAPSLKHRAILMTLYSAGLRVSEVVHLRLEDIDSQRMMIRVGQGKGRKDRYVMLSGKLLETLRRYWLKGRPDPWLFPGQVSGRPLAYRSVDRLFVRAKERAGIRKRVCPHSLRHSFATHLRERIALCRKLPKMPPEVLKHAPHETWEELLLRLTGKDVTRAPHCAEGRLRARRRRPGAPCPAESSPAQSASRTTGHQSP